MATVVERPTPALNNMNSTNNSQVEVIDVDLYESPPQRPPQAASSSGPASRMARPSPEVISLVDSDDESDEMVGSSSRPSNPRPQRRQLFSPPPPRQSPYASIPPMPPIPAQYAGHTSFPRPELRRRPQPVPPIIRPNQEPFAFENNLALNSAGPSRQRNNNQTPFQAPPPAAPPSHHVPVMGFGGALLSQRARLPRRTRLMELFGSAVPLSGRITITMPDEDSEVYLNLGNDDQDEAYIPRLLRTWAFRRTRHPHPNAAPDKYKQHFTHPTELEPGFTADFAPTANDKPQTRLFPPTSADQPIIVSDDEPPSHTHKSSSVSTSKPSALSSLLVCARCMSPLLLNSAMTEEDAKEKRVWGLRCGHLLDEKCLNEVGQPQPLVDSISNSKGKGKAKAVEQPAYGENVEEPNVVPVQPFQQENSIRSRLRSRLSTAQPALSQLVGTSSSQALDSLLEPPAKRRRGPNKKPKIQAEYEWKCPVPNCNTAHVSVKVDGIWGPQKDIEGVNTKAPGYQPPRGAIPVFA
ncbi:hypothetical protein CVT24_005706 [Panaeolus cyanescens]|uniref:Uncharacterized protein n=1 Tax=Panaeolus cyanescens TaxID=181874 RepID=A0A409V9A1_9AGAR|nr:hypothetical protein CVT24_005706 [Panaeolus cyanescens]